MALKDNLVAYWKLDESSGNAADSFNSYTLTNTGTATYSSGKINNGCALNGSSQYLGSTSSGLQTTGNQSWSYWIRPDTASGSRYLLWNTYENASSYGMIQSLENSSGLKLRIHTITSTGNTNSTNLATITGDGSTWTHLVITFSSGTYNVYVNGSAISPVTGHPTAQVVTPQMKFGQDSSNGGGNWYKGMFDEMGYWTKVLTASEVTQLYNGGAGLPFSQIVPLTLGEYTGAGSGTTKLLLHLNGSSADSSGNNNNGTDTSISYSQANGKFGQGAGASAGSIIGAAPLTYTEINAAYTISLFFKMNTFVNNGHFFGISATNGSSRTYLLFRCINRTTDNWEIYGQISASGQFITLKSGISSDTSWHHLVITYNGSHIIMSLDGGATIVDTTCTMTNTSGTDNAYGVLSGWDGGGNGTCSVDEVIVENVAWSAEKIKKYYTMTKGRFGII